MTTGIRRRGWTVLAGAAAALLTAPSVATAQADGGPRWQAWLGCWETSALASAPTDAPAGASMLCVVPTADESAVEVVSVEAGSIGSRSTIRADGAQHSAQREGCSGWESAEWSADGTRLYLRSEYTCEGGVERKSSGMMAFAPGGDWIDVQAVTAGGNGGVQAVRYRPVSDDSAIPADLASSIASRSLASSAARLAAAARIDATDVIEASRGADPLAVEAWLLERDQSFTVDARTLTQLADAGVSTRVIDLLVALSYPEMFAVDNASGDEAVRRGPPPVWDPWGRPGYGGYYPYGGRRGRWYGGYPSVIVVRSPDNSSGNGGKAVKGGGYRRGDGGSAEPTSRPSSGGDAARSGGGGSGGSSTGRTARPKDD
jgi:hypothetical protein